MLERHGYTVEGVRDSFEALELFKKSPESFDLVITDYTMPKMTGDTFATKLLEIRPDIPIILATGMVQQDAAQQAKEIGIKEVIMKPFRPSRLIRLVQDTLSQSRETSHPE